jgi:hypothetical protein
MRFTDRRVQALLSVCCTLALLPAGFTNRDLRHHLAPLLGHTPEAMTSGQISYDLRRLRTHGVIERINHTRSYQLTPTGLAHALFLTHLAQRFLIPGHPTSPTPSHPQTAACEPRPAPTRPPSPTSLATRNSPPDHVRSDDPPRYMTRSSRSRRRK